MRYKISYKRNGEHHSVIAYGKKDATATVDGLKRMTAKEITVNPYPRVQGNIIVSVPC